MIVTGQVIGQTYMNHRSDSTRPDFNPNVFDYSEERILPGVRYSLSVEAAETRRRAKNEKQ